MYNHNNQILVEDLPSADQILFESVDPKSMTISRIQTGLFFGIVLIVAFIVIYLIHSDWLTSIWFLGGTLLWILLFVWAYFFILREYRATGYALRQHDLVYRSGVYYQDEIVIPFNRVQHCEISQGPISRRFGLYTLTAYTAGSDGEVEISGLQVDIANRLKQYITSQIAVDEEE
jgi:uncharacterized protein